MLNSNTSNLQAIYQQFNLDQAQEAGARLHRALHQKYPQQFIANPQIQIASGPTELAALLNPPKQVQQEERFFAYQYLLYDLNPFLNYDTYFSHLTLQDWKQWLAGLAKTNLEVLAERHTHTLNQVARDHSIPGGYLLGITSDWAQVLAHRYADGAPSQASEYELLIAAVNQLLFSVFSADQVYIMQYPHVTAEDPAQITFPDRYSCVVRDESD